MLTAIVRPLLVLSLVAVTVLIGFSKPQAKERADITKPKVGVKEYLPTDEPSEAEAFSLLKRVPAGEKNLPIERYWKARQQAKAMRRYSTALSSYIDEQSGLTPAELDALGNWTQLGPGNIGGRTRVLVIAPSNPSLMYAAGVAGGVWKSLNSGASWTPLGDILPNLAVSSLAVDPFNVNVIYAGTGEGLYNFDAQRGAGIFKSTDGGATWGQIASPNDDPGFYYVNKLLISPNNSQRIYAGTRTGIWRSMDGGVSWSPSYLTSLFGGCLDLAIRSDRVTDYLFASLGTFDHATVLLNTDAGGAGFWGGSALPDFFGLGRISIAIAPSNQNVVYALASEYYNPWVDPDPPGPYQYGLHAVFRSTDGGMNWAAQVRNTNLTKLNTLLLSNPVIAFLVECGLGSSNALLNQGWYDNVIAVDPLDPNRVWVGGIDLFRSDDGGANWGLASYWWANSTDPHYAHADQHAIVFHPQYNGSTNRVMFVANDGGIFRTDNARANVATGPSAACDPANTAVTWTSLNNTYGVTQFYHGLPYPDNSSYFGGTQDNGTVRGTDAAGVNAWSNILGGDGGYVAIDRDNTNVLYAENTGLSIKKSTNGGASFSSAINGITEGSNNFLFISPFAMDPSNSQRLWTGGRHLWRTTNGGTSWFQATDAQYTGSPYSSIAISPTDPNYVAGGSSDGYVISTRLGLSADSTQHFIWTQRIIRNGYVSCVTYDPTDRNILYATYSSFNVVATDNHVYRSLDGGVNWRGIDGTDIGKLPDIPVHYLAVDPAATTHLYAGTDLGVFVSIDWGITWARENSGFSDVITESLAMNTYAGANTLYGFTHGRGVWRVSVPGNCATLSAASRAFTAAGGSGTVNVTAQGDCSWTAVSDDSWISILSGGGTGSGTVGFSVAANTSGNQPTPRVGTIRIAQQIFLVTQDGDNCGVSLSPPSQYLSAAAGSAMVDANANGGCALNAVSNDSWITITSPPTSTTGYLNVQYSYTANPTMSIRTGHISVSGPYSTAILAIRQAGQGCSYAISPSGISPDGTVTTTGSINVTATAGCSWTATASDSWVSITSGGSGTGNGTVNYTIARNNTPDFRLGHIIVAGYDFFILQYPGSCTDYAVSPTSFSFDQYGGQGSITVTTASNCQWGAVSNANWITITSPTIVGSGKATFTVAKNMTGAPRTTTLNLPFQDVTVNQSGNNCFMTLSPSASFFSSLSGSGSITVSGPVSCNWTSSSNVGWITITSGASGSGPGTVGYSVASNLSGVERVASLTIAGVPFTVTQRAGPPTSIRLENFSATAYQDQVVLEWQTGLEVDNLGFNLYRETTNGKIRINKTFIGGMAFAAGRDGLLTGRSYAWRDVVNPAEAVAYWLEDTNLRGVSTWHGPFRVKQVGGKPPARNMSPLLNILGSAKQSQRGGRNLTAGNVTAAPTHLVDQGVVAAAPAVKLCIKEEGWYRVTQLDLLAAGFSTSDPQNLQLYAEGAEQPILITSGEFTKGVTDASAFAIEFYATGLDTPTTDTRVYWLVEGHQPGRRIQVRKSKAQASGARSFDYTITRRDRSIYFAALRNGDAENFFGQIVAGQPVDQLLTLSHLDSQSGEPAELEVALQGVTELPGSADHSVEIRLNGAVIGRMVFDGQQHAVEVFRLKTSLLREGDNTITLTARKGAADISLIDYLRLTYAHRYESDQDYLRCSASVTRGPAQKLSGFSSPSIRVIDVTDPASVEEITGKIGAARDGYSITVDVLGPQRELLAFTDANVKRPAAITLDQPSSLRQAQDGSDLVIVARRELIPMLLPLAELRQAQGLTVQIVDIQDVYDEFSFGEGSPAALRDFLAYTQVGWTHKPTYVLLAGAASYDPRNYLGYGDTDVVPTKLIDTSYMETASDDWFVDFDGDGIADIAIGRLPVHNAAEAELMVSKLLAYEHSDSSNEALLVADENDGFNFEQASANLVTLVPSTMRATVISRGLLGGEQARKTLLEALNRGPKVVNYAGHGSVNSWRGALLQVGDAASLANSEQLSLYTLMTCLNGYYDPGTVSLGEALLVAAPGGAVAVWASTGMSMPVEQARADQEFFRLVFNDRGLKDDAPRLGDVARRAKQASIDRDVRMTWVLLGDPTMRLR